MTCDQSQALLSAYLDGELDAAHSQQVEEHLQDCHACAASARLHRTLSQRIQSEAPRYQAPPALLQSLKAPHAPRPWVRTLLAVAASLIIAIPMTWVIATWHGSIDPLAGEVASAHLRSLLASHLADVISTDQHTVKPWFAGKLDFSPPVTDFAPQGFPLTGGRLDVLANRPVAALIYTHGKHTINVFIAPTPDAADSAPEILPPINGFNLVRVTHNKMTFHLASDLNAAELEKLAILLSGS